MEKEIKEITTDLAALKDKIVAFVEMINSKDDWDSIDEIKRNVLESKDLTILLLTIIATLLKTSQNKELFVDSLAQICDDAIKLNGVLELFDKPVFKMGISAGYDVIYSNEKFKITSADVLVKIEKMLVILKEKL